jgi:type VI secretion system secreted protein Hcp
MAVDMFLKIDGVKGEAQDSKHKDEVDVLAWSWGVSNSGSMHVGGGGGSGKANVQDLSFTKYVDKATPTLMLFSCNGTHIKEATLVVRKAGGDSPVEYLTIKMSDILVSSVSTGGSGGSDRLTENVTFNFSKVALDYVPQNAKGAPEAKIPMTWNIATNTK